eukprot:5432402-Ditylum_brightwellii.AAC.1
MFMFEDIPKDTTTAIQAHWKDTHPFVAYNNHATNPILPANCIFLNKLDTSQVPIPRHHKINGIGATSQVEGEGIDCWTNIDQNSQKKTIESPAYYVPSASIRLYSPQAHFSFEKVNSLEMNATSVKLHLSKQCIPLLFPFTKDTLATQLYASAWAPTTHSPDLSESSLLLTTDLLHECTTPQSLLSTINNEKNISNLTASQLELLAWHWKFNHINMHEVQCLIHPTHPLDSSDTSEEYICPYVVQFKQPCAHTCPVPKYVSCILGKIQHVS